MPEWHPSELGLGRAGVLGVALVAGLTAGLAWVAVPPTAPPAEEPMAVHLSAPSEAWPAPVSAQSSAPPVETAPPPDLVPPPLADAPLVAPVPDPLSEIAVARAPEPVATPTPEPVVRPASPTRRPAIPHRPSVTHRTTSPDASAMSEPQDASPATPHPAPIAAPAPPADTTSGLGPYQSGLHRQIERNMLADRSVSRLGVGGTALIVATIAPDGRLLAAHVARSSGVRAIDLAALGAVERGGFVPFGQHMPAGPISIGVPISVEPD